MSFPRMLTRRVLGLTLGAALLGVAHASPAAAALSPGLYILTNANSVAMISAGFPAQPATSMPVSGLGDGETLAAIDVRPQNGRLYGLTSSAGGVRLYLIDATSGSAVATPLTPGPVQFNDGVNPVPIAATSFGMDFNPSVDRVRVVASGGASGGLNFRMNPNTGGIVDGDNGGAAGSVLGVNPDGAIKGATTTVDDTAYTNSSANVTVTTQYTIDAATDRLYIQNPPNSGTQTAGVSLTLNGAALDFSGQVGFDIPFTVAVSAANSPASGTAFAALTVGGATGLYAVDLTTGAVRPAGNFAATGVIDIALVSTPPAGLTLSADGTQLQRFLLSQPGTVVTAPITAIAPGETLVGIDGRPATGQLFGVAINDTLNNGTIYLIDPQLGVATAIGTPGSVAFVDAAGTPVDLPPASAGYGVDFNPTVDRIRVVTASGLNFRLNQLTGAPVDGDLGGAAGSVTGNNTDGPISGPTTTVDATAYTNNFPGVMGMTRTTQYTLDAASNRLFIQNPPNSGTQTTPLTITLGGATLDFTAASGFDIPPDVAVATANAPATGRGYAALTVGGTTSLYAINLATGAAALVGPVGAGTSGVSGLVVWSAPLRSNVFLPIVAQ